MANLLSIQFRPKIGNKQANLEKVEQILKDYENKNIDMVLVPEFFTTGISHDAMINYPEDENGGETIKFMCELAKKHNTNIIAGSVIEKSEDKLYNTSFVINRQGEIIEKYRKIHLFNYLGGTEGERITAGNEVKVVNLDFAKVGLSICFDMRYPMHFRKLIEKGAEIIVCPTAWCALHDFKQRQIDIWKAFNITRASENLVYMVSSNQTGKIDSFLTNTGNSMIVSPEAVVLANANEDEGAIFAEVDMNLVRDFKKTYPVAELE